MHPCIGIFRGIGGLGVSGAKHAKLLSFIEYRRWLVLEPCMCEAPGMVFKELPLSALHIHADHIPDPVLNNLEGDQLLLSVQIHGVLQALLVTDEYLIIDGARRYLCAKKLGLPTVPCIVRPCPNDGDFHLLRFVLHDTHDPLTEQEHAQYVRRIKEFVEKTGD